MICAPCRIAGRVLALGGLREVADAYHAKCLAIVVGQKTLCDCQHQTSESYITREASDAGRSSV